MSHHVSLERRFPPSEPCGCTICLSYCQRPGWWTVTEAARALKLGYARRMMLEIAPERTFGVLAPAFKGCESNFALQECASHGCGFLKDNRCELHGSSVQPLECRFCHHDRPGQGPICHAAIEREWRIAAQGRVLVSEWCHLTGIWDVLSAYGLEKLKS